MGGQVSGTTLFDVSDHPAICKDCRHFWWQEKDIPAAGQRTGRGNARGFEAATIERVNRETLLLLDLEVERDIVLPEVETLAHLVLNQNGHRRRRAGVSGQRPQEGKGE